MKRNLRLESMIIDRTDRTLKYQVGQILFNNGDPYNNEGWYIITKAVADNFGKTYTVKEIGGQHRTSTLYEAGINDIDAGNGRTRIVTKEAHIAYQESKWQDGKQALRIEKIINDLMIKDLLK